MVNGSPFDYPEENLTHDNIRPITEEEASSILELTKKLFEKKGITFFLFWGTLLGAVRDKGVIPGDEDVDCCIMDEEALVSNIPYFYERGLKIIRHLPGRLYSFRSNDNCYIDFYVVRPLHHSLWSLWCYHVGNKVMEKKYFRKFKEYDFLGGKYLVPENEEAMVERMYGKTWRVPQKGHSWNNDVKSYYFWRHKAIPFMLEAVGYPYWRHLLKGNMTQAEALKEWRQYKEDEKKRKR